jgi:hypothetical protein
MGDFTLVSPFSAAYHHVDLYSPRRQAVPMDAQRFDAWTRRLRSRRTTLTGLAGLMSMVYLTTADSARAKPCPPGKKRCRTRCIARRLPCCRPSKKRCGKRCIPKRTPCCGAGLKPCGTRCIGRNTCCSDADCETRRLCVNGTCIIGQGTCATGADSCTGGLLLCGARSNCLCRQTTAGQTRCGLALIGSCGACLSDANCEKNHPDTPGAFCFQGGPDCGCLGTTGCMAPCPA